MPSTIQANGAAAGQDIAHLHVHLLPRYDGDARLTIWQRDANEVDRLDQVSRILR